MSENKIEKKYTVEEFCKKYNEITSETNRHNFIKKIINKHYVPYELKIAVCEKIIEKSYFIKSEGDSIKKRVNSPIKYILYCLWLVKEYSCVEVDFSNLLYEFNLLNKNDLLDLIYKNIPEKEHKEFHMILEMVENDLLQNEYEIHAFISNEVERFGYLFGNIVKHSLNSIADAIENMDEKTLNNIFSKFNDKNILNNLLNIINNKTL